MQNNDLYPLQRLYKETAFLQFSVAQGGYFYNRLMHFDPLLYWCFATLMKCKSFKNCILIPRLIVISGLFSSLHSTPYPSDVGVNRINAQPFSFGHLLSRKHIYMLQSLQLATLITDNNKCAISILSIMNQFVLARYYDPVLSY